MVLPIGSILVSPPASMRVATGATMLGQHHRQPWIPQEALSC